MSALSGSTKATERETRRQERKNTKAAGKLAQKIIKRFAVCRVQKVKTKGGMSSLGSHNLRTGKQPENADPNKADQNRYWLKGGAKTITEAVENRISEAGITPRKNAVRMLEHVMSYSPERPPKDMNKWVKDNKAWADKRYGAENVVGVQFHGDETTGHIHLQCVPIVSQRRKVRGKDEYGAEQLTLNAKHYCDGRAKLSQMQDSYAEAMASHGLKRGVVKCGNHNPNHVDVRTRRGELAADYKYKIAVTENKFFNAENRAFRAERNMRAARAGRSVAESEIKELKLQLDEQHKKESELKEQNQRLVQRLNQVDPVRIAAQQAIPMRPAAPSKLQ